MENNYKKKNQKILYWNINELVFWIMAEDENWTKENVYIHVPLSINIEPLRGFPRFTIINAKQQNNNNLS